MSSEVDRIRKLVNAGMWGDVYDALDAIEARLIPEDALDRVARWLAKEIDGWWEELEEVSRDYYRQDADRLLTVLTDRECKGSTQDIREVAESLVPHYQNGLDYLAGDAAPAAPETCPRCANWYVALRQFCPDCKGTGSTDAEGSE